MRIISLGRPEVPEIVNAINIISRELAFEVNGAAPGYIAEALGLAGDFADNDPVTVILGDNIFQDNGSSDESTDYVRKEFPSVKIIESRKNLGFAKGKFDRHLYFKERHMLG
ncbi:MAG: hypothetical protein V1854_04640 [Methanobacteriota archaeon]